MFPCRIGFQSRSRCPAAFFLFFLRISVPNERLISGVPVESAGASVLLDAGCVPHTDRWSLANVRGRCGRSAPRAAKPQKADQCSGSSLRWVVFCRHFTGPRARTLQITMSQAASQVKEEIKAEADLAYVNLKVKQQVALCRGSISISVDTYVGWRSYPFQN